MQKILMLILAMSAVFFISCGSSESNTCNPVCETGKTCVDGKCEAKADKCSTVTCDPGEVCDAGSGNCVNLSTDKCKNVTCTGDKVCDAGTGTCVDKSKCDPNPCSDGEVCDPVDGSCEAISSDNLDTIVKARKYIITLSEEDAKTGVAIPSPIEGVVIAVQKEPTDGNKYAAMILQADAVLSDGYAGIHVNLTNVTTQLTIGDLVSVKGQLQEFFNRTELVPASDSDLNIKSSGIPVPAAINVSSEDLVTDNHKKYESMLLNITNVPFNVTVKPDYSTIYDYTLKDSANKELTLSTYLDAKKGINLNVGQSVTKIIGVLTYSYSTLRLSPRDINDITAGSFPCGNNTCTASQLCLSDACMDITEENTDASCEDGIDNDGNGYTDCDDFSCSKSDTVTVCPAE